MRHACLAALVAAATLLTGCRGGQATQDAARVPAGTSAGAGSARASDLILPSGTSLDVTLATLLTSENASVGDAWAGSTRHETVLEGHDVIPAGSAVTGTVTSVTPARRGDRAMLDLGMRSVTVDGHEYRVRGEMESVTAGSTRARNLGAIGASTVAGAVAGHAIGKSDRGTILGGLIGAGAAAGVVSQTRGWQVVLKSGTPLTFTTQEAVAVRL